jgi:hypothetical protein
VSSYIVRSVWLLVLALSLLIPGIDGIKAQQDCIEGTDLCRPEPIPCETDADCPDSLICEIACPESSVVGMPDSGVSVSDGGVRVLDGGGVEISLCAGPTVGECVLEEVFCETDEECEANYTCAVTGTAKSCGSGGLAIQPTPDCPPGAECGPEPEPIPEQCELLEERTCVPRQFPCETDGDCPDGWSCIDFSFFPPNPEQDGYQGPPWWYTGEEKVAVACMPEGWTTMLARLTHEGGGAVDIRADGSGEQGGPGDSGESGESTQPEDDSGEGKDDGGCSVTSGRGTSFFWIPVIGAVLVVRMVRRRAPRL